MRERHSAGAAGSAKSRCNSLSPSLVPVLRAGSPSISAPSISAPSISAPSISAAAHSRAYRSVSSLSTGWGSPATGARATDRPIQMTGRGAWRPGGPG
eukprot:scaffold25948_cov36-Phaeocystis_antarctica.AAC.1